MTTYSNIQSAQSTWVYPLVRKRFLIQIPVSYVDTYNPNYKDLRFYDSTQYSSDDTTNTVYLVLFPDYEGGDEYSQTRKYEATSLGSSAVASTVRFGCKCSVKQSPIRHFHMVFNLVRTSENSNLTGHVPIKIIDFNLPDMTGQLTNVTSMGDVGTIRYGRIEIIKKPSNPINFQGDVYCGTPWEFSFSDINLTY
jgi:hypothetical protein